MKVTSDDLLVILLHYANSAIKIYVFNFLQRLAVWQNQIFCSKKMKTFTSSKSSSKCLTKFLRLSNDYIFPENFYFLLDCKIFKKI